MNEFDRNKGDFESLVGKIQSASSALQEDARLVINRNVTTRAWLTGFYIVEYEQHGNDRAKYGESLLKRLAERLEDKSFSLASLKNFRRFYLCYPELAEPIAGYLELKAQKSQSVISLLQSAANVSVIKGQSPISQLPLQHPSPVSNDGFALLTGEGEVRPVPQMLFNRLSFTHIVQLLHLNDPLKRSFYAIEAMRGPWSVRELQRQIDSNYYERSGWSRNPELLASKVNEKAEKPSFREELKSHYVFEFLGLAAKNVIEEDELEQALIDHLEEFMLELGMGFCLEARQKKLLIDDRYFKADLVFYHRILKCHCILELKGHRLDYADMAQLNMYLEYYRRHYMQPDDNPPVGLLLCTEYGQEMVEYVTPNIDPQLFVAKYELQLPSKEIIREFLLKENKG
ncbi:MAG: DUF1016 family protein [Prevotella sp.]|nr:DUF1016 family protein [Prevotella sp.]